MRRELVGVLLACCGCRAVFGLDPPTLGVDAAMGDARGTDTSPVCLGRDELEVCAPTSLPSLLDISSSTSMALDTDEACTFVDPDHPTWCILGAHNVVIEGAVRATGSRPLVIVATQTLAIKGRIDASSSITDATTGPAANGPCSTPGGAASNANGGGGGAGGTFGTRGGNGGAGSSGTTSGGMATMVTPGFLETLRGGCPGSAGGVGASGNGGSAAAGGGALYLVAGTQLTIEGRVNASGAGGDGGNISKGGGTGGGSGGMIALWSPIIAIDGELFANGGGGGGGADNGAAGSPGGDGVSYQAAAGGGSGGGSIFCGTGPGCGGAGSLGTNPGANGITDATGAGGGGGGGGGGVILVVSGQTLSANFSPPPRT